MNNSELKVNFWRELWSDLINDFLKRSYGFILYSPQILVEDIIIEIEENQFKNMDNKRYFSIKIEEYLKNDEVVNTILKSDFTLLQRAIYNKKNSYVLSLCKRIKTTLENGVYFENTLRLVTDLILSKKEFDINFVNKITYYSQSLIVDFIKKTYVLEDIKGFLENIFDNYRFFKNPKMLRTDYPHLINYDDHKDQKGDFDLKSYEQAVIEKLDSLSLEDRIKTLKYYYNKETEKVKYIFVVRGLKSDEILDETILGVNFYSLHKKKFTEPDLEIFEDLQYDTKLEKKYLQVSVEVDYLLPRSSLTVAQRKIETAIDILYCYFKVKTPISYLEYGYSVFDKNGKMLYSQGGNNFSNESVSRIDSLDLNVHDKHLKDVSKYEFLSNDIGGEAISKIKNALRWHRKAEQSIREEDKILNYWIALENLFNTKEDVKIDILDNSKQGKVHLIQEIVSARQVFTYVYDYGWELFWYYRNRRLKKNFPKELVLKAQLESKEVYLKDFIDCLDEIKKYESNLFILDKINSVKLFYNDYGFAKSTINNHITNVKHDILMIYRLRNLIVHNAHYDNTLLPYYVWKVKTYCGGLLRKFIQDFDETKSLSSMIFDVFISKEKYMLDFDNGMVNLFERKNS